jgi:hypothetical protein
LISSKTLKNAIYYNLPEKPKKRPRSPPTLEMKVVGDMILIKGRASREFSLNNTFKNEVLA